MGRYIGDGSGRDWTARMEADAFRLRAALKALVQAVESMEDHHHNATARLALERARIALEGK